MSLLKTPFNSKVSAILTQIPKQGLLSRMEKALIPLFPSLKAHMMLFPRVLFTSRMETPLLASPLPQCLVSVKKAGSFQSPLWINTPSVHQVPLTLTKWGKKKFLETEARLRSDWTRRRQETLRTRKTSMTRPGPRLSKGKGEIVVEIVLRPGQNNPKSASR